MLQNELSSVGGVSGAVLNDASGAKGEGEGEGEGTLGKVRVATPRDSEVGDETPEPKPEPKPEPDQVGGVGAHLVPRLTEQLAVAELDVLLTVPEVTATYAEP